ncbi:MAG: phage minor head protein [Thermodesulfobacteriota bacterium]
MPGLDLTPLPPEEAIRYFQAKGNRITWDWTDMWREDHAKAFTVAKAAKLDLLQDIRAELDTALVGGGTLADFQKNLIPILQRKGWWGREIVDGKEVQLGSPARLKTIFNTNIQTAYQVGHYRDMTDPDVLAARPFWRYTAVNDRRTRIQHRAWDNTVLPANDPWWDTHYPPNGFNCRCSAVSLSRRELERDGLAVTASPDTSLPIDPGWDYNPGRVSPLWDQGQAAVEKDSAKLLNTAAFTPGQKTWRDYGRPDLRRVPLDDRLPTPDLLPEAPDRAAAVRTLAAAFGLSETRKWTSIATADGDQAIVHLDWLPHLVEKRGDAKERYAHFIRPTLEKPFEVWLTDYGDQLRKRYIGLFTGQKDFMAVIALRRDGSLLWNVMQASDRDMNKHRKGTLLWSK